jgi:hypothetical protein
MIANRLKAVTDRDPNLTSASSTSPSSRAPNPVAVIVFFTDSARTRPRNQLAVRGRIGSAKARRVAPAIGESSITQGVAPYELAHRVPITSAAWVA